MLPIVSSCLVLNLSYLPALLNSLAILFYVYLYRMQKLSLYIVN